MMSPSRRRKPRPPGGSGSGRPPWLTRLAEAIVSVAAVMVPHARRRAWHEEWSSEIWHFLQLRERENDRAKGMSEVTDGTDRSGLKLVVRCLGAFPHALWIWGEEWSMDTVVQDIRYALRTLAKRPLFALMTIITVALGIGGTTAIFSLVNAILLRPLPIPEAERVMWVWGAIRDGVPMASVSPPRLPRLSIRKHGVRGIGSLHAHGWDNHRRRKGPSGYGRRSHGELPRHHRARASLGAKLHH